MQNVTATSLRLTPGQVYFLDGFRARVRRDTGCRIPRAKLVQALVEAITENPSDFVSLPIDEGPRSAESASSVTLQRRQKSVMRSRSSKGSAAMLRATGSGRRVGQFPSVRWVNFRAARPGAGQ